MLFSLMRLILRYREIHQKNLDKIYLKMKFSFVGEITYYIERCKSPKIS